jgi:adenylate cyclase
MSDVFISYKREDLPAVNRLVAALRAEGVGVWWDQDIPPNAPWEATIERELAAAPLVIVAWSPASVASDNVKAEARWARGQGRLLQVFVEPCEPPLFFGERQGVDLRNWSGAAEEPTFRALLQAVRAGATRAPEAALSEPPTPLPLPSKPSIAVMPFANLSGDPEQDYFADGMVVEIVEALTRIRSIFVIASGSTLSFRGKGISARDAARQLGVRYVLDGSVRKAGGRVRIGVQLIDASDGDQIWTHRFEDTLEDVFALQDQVAISVAGQIEPTVQQAEVRHAVARPTENMGSYDLYLRALPLFRSFARADMLQALELLDRALALDPDFGPALSLAASCRYSIHTFGWAKDPELTRREGIALTHKALKVAGDDPSVLASAAGPMMSLEGDMEGAATVVARALALNPGSSRAWMYSGLVRLRAGEIELAVEQIEMSRRLEPAGPNRPVQTVLLGVAKFAQGHFSETIALMKEAIRQADHPPAYYHLAASYGHLGQTDAAREALARARQLAPKLMDEYVQNGIWGSVHRTLLMEGIALAEGPAGVA